MTSYSDNTKAALSQGHSDQPAALEYPVRFYHIRVWGHPLLQLRNRLSWNSHCYYLPSTPIGGGRPPANILTSVMVMCSNFPVFRAPTATLINNFEYI